MLNHVDANSKSNWVIQFNTCLQNNGFGYVWEYIFSNNG